MTSDQGGDGRFAAVVLAGGGGRRLGGVDKASLDLAGSTLLARTLTAVSGARPVVVVGPPRDLPAGVLQVQEHPAGGGPVAGVAAGLAILEETAGLPGLLVVLACDMPFVEQAAVARLVDAVHGAEAGIDGAAFVDGDGRRQHLAAAYRTGALREALNAAGQLNGAAMRDVAKRLTVVEIEADPETTLDCDTWSDVRRTRHVLEER